jgi:hypothetical protein
VLVSEGLLAAIRRHPIRAWLVAVVLLYMAASGVKTVVDTDPPHPQTWATWVAVGFMAYAALVLLVIFRRPSFVNNPKMTESKLAMIHLTLGFSSMPFALAAVLFGAETWVLWIGLLVSAALTALGLQYVKSRPSA